MKKLLLIAASLIAANVQAQITLEHTYNDHAYMWTFAIEDEGDKYFATDIAADKVNLYNANHTVYKSIPVPLAGATFFNAVLPSKYLFDQDGEVEVLVLGTDNGQSVGKLLDEHGNVEFTFDGAVGANARKVDGQWKLLVNVDGSPSDYMRVYSLPGTWSGQPLGIKPAAPDNGNVSITPNPIGSIGKITYQLPAGIHDGVLNVYNTAGMSVKQYQVTSQFSDVIINRGELPSGVYLYNLITDKGATQAQRFIIE